MTFLNQIDGNWNILKGAIRQQLARMTEDNEAEKAARWEKMVGEVQVELGIPRDEAIRKLEQLQHESDMEMMS